MLNYQLKTKYSKSMNLDKPWTDYPRPLLRRESYLSLNGKWEYAISKENEEPTFNGKILVPFCVESSLSGVRQDLNSDEILWYRLSFKLPKDFIKDNVILHFGGVMQIAEVYLNDKLLGKHYGGFLPFDYSIKDYLKDENVLIIKVENKPDFNYGVGKEGKVRGGMWYTKTTGIYKSVWIESYSSKAITGLTINTYLDGNVKGTIKSNGSHFTLKVSYQSQEILKKEVGNEFEFKVDNPQLWDVNNPNLYDLEIEGEDEAVKSYFAFREFKVTNQKFYLNNREIFVNGVLDQGYFSDGIYTPATSEAFKDDILRMKALGFNALRKHIKVENELFYYYADKYGMLILQDFPNTGKYSFFKDSILPVIGIKNIKKKKVSDERYQNFIQDNKQLIDLLKGHPSVIYYTIFNEGWGEFKSQEMYQVFKDYAPSYVFDTASGWFDQTKSDVLSIHNYFFKLKVPKSDRPVILSEYGGYNYRIEGHSFNDEKEYGYHKVSDGKQFKEELDLLFEEIDELKKQGLAGAIYTQLSDVEDEANGLITYNREVIKYHK